MSASAESNSATTRRALNKLTDARIRAFVRSARAGKAPKKKLFDGGGLYLTITPAGTPVWRMKYRLGGIERLYAVGTYPAVGLEKARAEREELKALLKQGRDPVQTRALERAAGAEAAENTLEDVARAWLAKHRGHWSDTHYTKSRQALDRYIIPRLGRLPVRDIKPAMVAHAIEAIVRRGARETALKVLQHVASVFRYAQARGLRDDNPAEPVYEVLPRRPKKKRMPALLKLAALGEVLRKADQAKLSPAVRMAHRLCAFSAARISNVVEAEWKEFDLDGDVPTWTIPRAKMKSRDREHDHRIILPPQIAEELGAWREETGGKGYVFPSPAGEGHITREAVEKAYRETLGLRDKHSPHGWRSAFSTLARDHGFERDVVELALDHIHDNDVVRAYDRGERLAQRIKLVQWWGEQLAKAQRGAEVVPLGKGKAG